MSIWVVTLLMTFGRTTFGALYDVVPGSSDIFIRRFQMGVQLSGILLAGIGIVAVGRLRPRRRAAPLARGTPGVGVGDRRGAASSRGCASSALVLVLAPAWSELDTYDAHNATNIGLQADADAQQDPQIDELLAYVQAHPRGRVYAGQPTNWGQDFLVGAVPVFKYLESKDVDEVGYTLRTASLMTDPEYYFDDTNPGDYPLFGIGYIITPATMAPPVPADKVLCSDTSCLWALPDPGYIHVYDTTGVLTATRADVGSQSVALLDSPLLGEQRDLTVAFNGQAGAAPTAGTADAAGAAGPRDRRARRPGERLRPRRRADEPARHGRPERVLRPRVERHGRRPPGTDRHGRARPGGRRGRARRAHGRLQLRGLRVLRCAVRAGPRGPGGARRRTARVAAGGRSTDDAASARMH